MKHWLVKSEPGTYSIDDLKRDRRTGWEGVRNHQAKNFMRDDMSPGDLVLFHHSGAKPPAIVGVARVVRANIPDPTAWDPKSQYHDPRSTREEPIWMMVELEFVERFATDVSMAILRTEPRLEGLALLQRGQRLSVQPVGKGHFEIIRKLGLGSGMGSGKGSGKDSGRSPRDGGTAGDKKGSR